MALTDTVKEGRHGGIERMIIVLVIDRQLPRVVGEMVRQEVTKTHLDPSDRRHPEAELEVGVRVLIMGSAGIHPVVKEPSKPRLGPASAGEYY